MKIHKILVWLYVYMLDITCEVNSKPSLELMHPVQVDERQYGEEERPNDAGAIDDKMISSESKYGHSYAKVNHQQFSKKQLALLNEYAANSSPAYLEKQKRLREMWNSKISNQSRLESSNANEQRGEAIIVTEQDALKSNDDIIRRRAQLVTPRLREETSATSPATGIVVAPIAKPLPRLLFEPLSADIADRELLQFDDDQDLISTDNCEIVDELLTNRNNSILLQTIRDASKELEMGERIILLSLAERIYNTVLSNESIDDNDKFARIKVLLIDFIDADEKLANKLLPLRIGEFGTLQQLLTCL